MEWFDYGKYSYYVWSSYGITFVVLALNIVLPIMQHRTQLKKIRRRQVARKNQ
jgi:heme exporter protein D